MFFLSTKGGRRGRRLQIFTIYLHIISPLLSPYKNTSFIMVMYPLSVPMLYQPKFNESLLYVAFRHAADFSYTHVCYKRISIVRTCAIIYGKQGCLSRGRDLFCLLPQLLDVRAYKKLQVFHQVQLSQTQRASRVEVPSSLIKLASRSNK